MNFKKVFSMISDRKPLSLSGKIIVANTVLMSVLLVVLMSYVLLSQIVSYREEVTKHSNTLVTVSTATITKALINKDLATLDVFANTLLLGNDVLFVRILDKAGIPLVSQDKNSLLQQPFQLDDNSLGTHNGGVLDVSSEVFANGISYGRLEIGIDAGEILENIQSLMIELMVGGFLGILLIGLLTRWFLHHFTRRLNSLRDALYGLVQGDVDFNVAMPVEGEDETAQIAIFFNLFVNKLKDMVDQILYVAEGLSSSSLKAQHVTISTSEAVEQQAQSISGLAQSIDQLADSSEQVSQQVSGVAEQAEQVQEQAETGRKVVESAVSSMSLLKNEVMETRTVVSELAENNSSISNVLDMISSIAEQTNLLALNAAIEAARAGEHGRGFAVVADEVRNLSQRTTEATGEIRELIDTIQHGSHEAVNSMERNEVQAGESLEQISKAGSVFGVIADAIVNIHQNSADSADLAGQEQKMAQEIYESIKQIESNVHNLALMAKQNISDNSDLSQFSVQLEMLVGTYSGKVTETEGNVSSNDEADIELF